MLSQLDKLGVNVASVVVGGLIVVICVAWINMFKSMSDHLFFDDGQEGIRSLHEFQKKLLSALCITVLCLWFIVIIYIIYNRSIENYRDLEQSGGLTTSPGFLGNDSSMLESGEFMMEGMGKG